MTPQTHDVRRFPGDRPTPEPAVHRILVVDDDPDLAGALESLLQSEGYVVEVATDSAAALERAVELSPQVILLDYKMPGMDGATLIQALRGRGVDSRMVLVTGSGLGEAVADFLGVEYLAKPVALDDLLACVLPADPPEN